MSGQQQDGRDPVATAIEDERRRQEQTLDLIASENHVSTDVLRAQGSVFTNKYAPGTIEDRYYVGCEFADQVEQIAIDRAKDIFGANHVNVQPHSGTQANMAVYFAVLDPGETMLSLSLTDGGHISHGYSDNASGRFYDVNHYHIDPETGELDYDALARRAQETDIGLIVSGSSSFPREFDFKRIQEIAEEVGAYHLADIAHVTGLIAGGVHENPVGTADFVTGSTHKSIRSGRGGIVMCQEEHTDAIDEAVYPGVQGAPLVHNIAGKAVGLREASMPEFEEYAAQVVANAKAMAEEFRESGLSLVSGGTDKHFALVDLHDYAPNLSGREAEELLAETGIAVNKATIPGENTTSNAASGLRIGTPGITTRGFEIDKAKIVARVITMILKNPSDQTIRSECRETVKNLCDQYPIYG